MTTCPLCGRDAHPAVLEDTTWRPIGVFDESVTLQAAPVATETLPRAWVAEAIDSFGASTPTRDELELKA